jgi:hypothetical protein
MMAVKLNWIGQAFHIMTIFFGKVSITIFILRIKGNKGPQAWALYILISFLLVGSVISVAFIFAQCSPTSALWNHAIVGKCWSPKILVEIGYFTSCTFARLRETFQYARMLTSPQAYSSFSDFVLAVLPCTWLWKLNMKLKMKISLAVVMGLGILCVTSCDLPMM